MNKFICETALIISLILSFQQLKSVQDSISFLSEHLKSSKVSLTEAFLVEMKNNLDDRIWTGPPPENGVMHIEECNQFHRVWSAIQFVICLPLRENELTVEYVKFHNYKYISTLSLINDVAICLL